MDAEATVEKEGVNAEAKVNNRRSSVDVALLARRASVTKVETAPPGPPTAMTTTVAKYLELAAPLMVKATAVVKVILPYAVKFVGKCNEIYAKTQPELLMALVGAVFCFFGGVYPTLFATAQAFSLCGWPTTRAALVDLYEESVIILEESAKDDEVDDDGDGISDVLQIDAKTLLLRKTSLVLTKCDPGKINTAVGGLYMAWVAVLATLKIQFARTITFALVIANVLQHPVDLFVKRPLDLIVPTSYARWTPVILGWLCKAVAMSVAWYLQRIQSAYTSAIIGGLMFSRGLMSYALHKNINPGGFLPKNHEDTYIDEVVGWSLAAVGFYTQWTLGFSAPFPLNLVMFPFEWLEYYIQWTITSSLE